MKKLMVIAAIAMAVSGAQAASYVWKATGGNIFDSSGKNTKYAGSVYVFDNSVVSMSSLYEAFAADTSYNFGANAAATLTAANGAIVTTSGANQFEYGTEASGLTSFSFYLAIVDGDNLYVSNLLEDRAVYAPPTAASLSFGTQNNGTTTFSGTAPSGSDFAGAGHWSAVPEPTSGLLMLLGMAGLALRRRRA